ncbi:unnamed protein product [Penicillium salamii]|nr:unnamed protein product [Penicillium salamii]
METRPSSNAAEDSSFETEIHPTTVRTAWIINRPSSREEIEVAIDIIKEEFDSDCPPPSQYLLVKCIPSKLFKALLKDEETPKGVRVLILGHKQEILYRIIPGDWYQFIVPRFNKWLDYTLEAMGLSSVTCDFTFGGATRQTNGMYRKEPDSSFFLGNPSATGGPVVWPSLVLEAGISESLPQLRADAQWWYANSGNRTKIVVLISTQSNLSDVVIEIWTEIANQSDHMTRGRQSHVLGCTQTARYTNGVGTGLPLDIPFEDLMRRPKRNQEEEDPQLTLEWVKWLCD